MYLTSVIAKANDKAWLRTSFENNITGCELEFFILASVTQHVASQLFDLYIAAPDGQRRGILLDNTALAKFNGSKIWTSSPLEKVKKLLGAQAAEAYQLSPSRTGGAQRRAEYKLPIHGDMAGSGLSHPPQANDGSNQAKFHHKLLVVYNVMKGD
ncbi:hypothetical protein CEP52_008752 [Fusarium oligoseptatum]|uniref:Uncharacterized protein n=1 Tax=Fusarium oligoseptatum TaxID=2604345 RepID=A0A428TGH8_9HYPO|nr:hypothetical protein CEP52_008752 [Fusarium oligoseptatum]